MSFSKLSKNNKKKCSKVWNNIWNSTLSSSYWGRRKNNLARNSLQRKNPGKPIVKKPTTLTRRRKVKTRTNSLNLPHKCNKNHQKYRRNRAPNLQNFLRKNKALKNNKPRLKTRNPHKSSNSNSRRKRKRARTRINECLIMYIYKFQYIYIILIYFLSKSFSKFKIKYFTTL